MDWLHTLLIAAAGAVVIVGIWFGRLPGVRRARRASNGGPNMIWWISFGAAVVLVAYVANQLPDSL
jgi:uncharacterized membrane protein